MGFNFNVKIRRSNEEQLPINHYDQNGNCIYTKYKDSDEKVREEWIDRDPYGNIIHVRDEDGDECWSDYDENGNEIYFRHDNEERFYNYDENNNLIETKTTYHL